MKCIYKPLLTAVLESLSTQFPQPETPNVLFLKYYRHLVDKTSCAPFYFYMYLSVLLELPATPVKNLSISCKCDLSGCLGGNLYTSGTKIRRVHNMGSNLMVTVTLQNIFLVITKLEIQTDIKYMTWHYILNLKG